MSSTLSEKFKIAVTKVAVRGKAQKAIVEYLEGKHDVQPTDMARAPAFRGINFKDIMTAIKALADQGLIRKLDDGSIKLKKDKYPGVK
jgi:hypothetical protein